MLIILLIVSPVTALCYNSFKFDYHIFDPTIALIIILLLGFYVRNIFVVTKDFGGFIPNIHKVLQILSVGSMTVFSLIDVFGNGRVLMSEISLVFVVCVPIEIYISISNRNRIMAHLNFYNYKSISISFIVGVLFTCLTSIVLLLGINSNPYLLITFSSLLSIPLFFIVLLGRELIV